MSVLRARRGRSPAAVLRRHEARQRADGARLQPSVPSCRTTGLRFLHRLRSLGAARTWRSSCSRRRSWPASRSSVFNHGNHTRDFTYVEDIAEGVIRASDQIAEPDPSWSSARPDPATSNAPFRLFNIGNNQAGHAQRLHRGDRGRTGHVRRSRNCCRSSPATFRTRIADVSELEKAVGYRPMTSGEGRCAQAFVNWYRDLLSSLMGSKLSKQNRPILMRNREHTFAGWDADLLRPSHTASGALNARSLLVIRLFKRAFGPQGDASRVTALRKRNPPSSRWRVMPRRRQIRLVPTSWGTDDAPNRFAQS